MHFTKVLLQIWRKYVLIYTKHFADHQKTLVAFNTVINQVKRENSMVGLRYLVMFLGESTALENYFTEKSVSSIFKIFRRGAIRHSQSFPPFNGKTYTEYPISDNLKSMMQTNLPKEIWDRIGRLCFPLIGLSLPLNMFANRPHITTCQQPVFWWSTKRS